MLIHSTQKGLKTVQLDNNLSLKWYYVRTILKQTIKKTIAEYKLFIKKEKN